jgi:Ni,Fe-hydrogenase III large subunit
MTQLEPLQAHRLAGRVSGDSTVAYAWAYCMALEAATHTTIPSRAAWLRALMLERERIAAHLGDLGALGNDAAFAFALAQFSRLREDWVRGSKAAFGHRFMMDCVVPGGVLQDLDDAQVTPMLTSCDALESDVLRLRGIFDSHAGLQDRFLTTGRVMPALASQLGLTGLAGRASSQSWDVRCDHPFVPYDQLAVTMATHHNGDVAARVALRFDEIFVALELSGAADGHRIERCHLHDPSWQNWPVLEHAILGNIVPDFPLINKSFNLSYSGQDL